MFIAGLQAFAAQPKLNFFSAGMGMSVISYRESIKPGYNSVSLTGRFAYVRRLSSRWNLSAATSMTLVPLAKNRDDTARFLDVDGLASYVLPLDDASWTLPIRAGAHFTTMVVTHNAFGYKNIVGPQLNPAVRKGLKNGDSISGYFKISLISDRLDVLAFSNNTIGTGLNYRYLLTGGRSLLFGLDATRLSFTLSGITVRSDALTLSTSFAF